MEQLEASGGAAVSAPTTGASVGEGSNSGNVPKTQRRRSVSEYARRESYVATRPTTTSRRPYSAYTKRDGEAENTPKYDDERSNREWWRFYVKVI